MYIYKSIDGCDIGIDIYETAQSPAPLLLMIHGGGFVFGSRRDISKEKINYFLSKGINVATVDYRLSPESTFADALDDVKDAVEWLKSHLNELRIPITGLFVMGYSAGGFLAYYTGTIKNRPDGIISMYGYADLSASWCREISHHYLQKTKVDYATATSLIGSKPVSSAPSFRFLYYLYLRQNGKWMNAVMKGDANDIEKLKALSPLHNVNSDYPKTLIVHGKLDQDVPYAAAEAIHQKLEGLNVPVEFIRFDDKGHDFDASIEPPEIATLYETIANFITNPANDIS